MEARPSKIFISCIKNLDGFKGKEYKLKFTVNETLSVDSPRIKLICPEYIEVNKYFYLKDISVIDSLKVELFEREEEHFSSIGSETFEVSNRKSVRDDDMTKFRVLALNDSIYLFVDLEDSAKEFHSDQNSHQLLKNALDGDKNLLNTLGEDKIELVNLFLSNLRFLRFLADRVNSYLKWDNALFTFILTVILSFFILHPRITLTLLPLAVLLFHWVNNRDFSSIKLEKGEDELNEEQKQDIFLDLAEFYNSLACFYTETLTKVERTDADTVQALHRQLVKLSALLGIALFFLTLDRFLWLIVLFLWFTVLKRSQTSCKTASLVLNYSGLTRVSQYFKLFWGVLIPFAGFEINQPARIRRSQSVSSEFTVTMEVLENERWWIFAGWCKNMLPVDRPPWSDSKGKLVLEKQNVKLPTADFVWADNWEVVVSDKTDPEGWQYGLDFSQKMKSANETGDIVRSRKWIRHCKKK